MEQGSSIRFGDLVIYLIPSLTPAQAVMERERNIISSNFFWNGQVIKDKKLVRKTDGTVPSPGAVSLAARDFKVQKKVRGRQLGWKKTSKAEDKKILQNFKKLRPPGHGIDARTLHKSLPKKIRMKVSQRTIIRRLADKGFKPEKKISKSDPGPALAKRRVKFSKKYMDYSSDTWCEKLQGAGDFKEFTYYPREMKPKFAKLRAPWTYMTKAEKQLPAFVRPKRWFPKKQYKKVTKQKIFGLTASNGKSLYFFVPKNYTGELWAKDVKKHLGPFLKKSFPGLSSFQILLDGEKLLHSPVAKAALSAQGITCLPCWPKYSPDMNPQENVWGWSEPQLRKREAASDLFSDFQKKLKATVQSYPEAASKKLIPSMVKRCQKCIDKEGAMLKY